MNIFRPPASLLAELAFAVLVRGWAGVPARSDVVDADRFPSIEDVQDRILERDDLKRMERPRAGRDR